MIKQNQFIPPRETAKISKCLEEGKLAPQGSRKLPGWKSLPYAALWLNDPQTAHSGFYASVETGTLRTSTQGLWVLGRAGRGVVWAVPDSPLHAQQLHSLYISVVLRTTHK